MHLALSPVLGGRVSGNCHFLSSSQVPVAKTTARNEPGNSLAVGLGLEACVRAPPECRPAVHLAKHFRVRRESPFGQSMSKESGWAGWVGRFEVRLANVSHG